MRRLRWRGLPQLSPGTTSRRALVAVEHSVRRTWTGSAVVQVAAGELERAPQGLLPGVEAADDPSPRSRTATTCSTSCGPCPVSSWNTTWARIRRCGSHSRPRTGGPYLSSRPGGCGAVWSAASGRLALFDLPGLGSPQRIVADPPLRCDSADEATAAACRRTHVFDVPNRARKSRETQSLSSRLVRPGGCRIATLTPFAPSRSELSVWQPRTCSSVAERSWLARRASSLPAARRRTQRHRRIVDELLGAGREVVVGNTNPTPADRAPLVSIARRTPVSSAPSTSTFRSRSACNATPFATDGLGCSRDGEATGDPSTGEGFVFARTGLPLGERPGRAHGAEAARDVFRRCGRWPAVRTVIGMVGFSSTS
jgi:hypothetical protein